MIQVHDDSFDKNKYKYNFMASISTVSIQSEQNDVILQRRVLDSTGKEEDELPSPRTLVNSFLIRSIWRLLDLVAASRRDEM